jgi:hypothetical protein
MFFTLIQSFVLESVDAYDRCLKGTEKGSLNIIIINIILLHFPFSWNQLVASAVDLS